MIHLRQVFAEREAGAETHDRQAECVDPSASGWEDPVLGAHLPGPLVSHAPTGLSPPPFSLETSRLRFPGGGGISN